MATVLPEPVCAERDRPALGFGASTADCTGWDRRNCALPTHGWPAPGWSGTHPVCCLAFWARRALVGRCGDGGRRSPAAPLRQVPRQDIVAFRASANGRIRPSNCRILSADRVPTRLQASAHRIDEGGPSDAQRREGRFFARSTGRCPEPWRAGDEQRGARYQDASFTQRLRSSAS